MDFIIGPVSAFRLASEKSEADKAKFFKIKKIKLTKLQQKRKQFWNQQANTYVNKGFPNHLQKLFFGGEILTHVNRAGCDEAKLKSGI